MSEDIETPKSADVAGRLDGLVGRYGLVFPVKNESLRRALAAKDNICPECSSDLDTGWECNNLECRYDAQKEALECTNTDVLLWLVAKNPKREPGQNHRAGRWA